MRKPPQPVPDLRHFVYDLPSPPNAGHTWVRVPLTVAHRVEWLCDSCGTRATPDSIGRMYFFRSPTDCEGKS